MLVAGILAVVLVAAGCSPPEPRNVPVLRFVEETSPPVFDPEAFVSEEVAAEWKFDGEPPGDWLLRDVASARADGVGWWLRPATRRVLLGRRLGAENALDASSVDLVAVTAESRLLGGADLHWAGVGEGLSPERHLQIRFSGRTRHTFLFRVGEHPRWRGRIEHLQITLWALPEMQVGVSSVKALREVVDPPALEHALTRPWRVELEEDSRVALAALPGRPVERTLTVPEGAELRLAYGVRQVGEVSDPVNFRVLLTPEGGPREVLAERVATAEDAWQTLALDLAPWAGREILLRLEASSQEEIDPRRRLPFFAHPEVVAPVVEAAKGDELPPNLILISADTLRADRLSLYGHGRATSPHLEAWARRRATVFESVVASAGWTLPSHVSIFSGLDAHRHGVNWPTRASDELTFLAELLHERGYATEAITGGGYLDQRFNLDQGFERYSAWARWRLPHETEAPHNLSRALGALGRLGDRPFFLFLHTYATHAPYAPWQPYFGRMSELDPVLEVEAERPSPSDHDGRAKLYLRGEHGLEPLEGELYHLPADQYDAGVARLDGLLEPLLRALEEPGLRRRTVVAFTSDHGEMLGERGLWEHGQVHDPVLRVPLLVATPDGFGAGRRVERQVRSVDIVPTLLELLGLEVPTGLDGKSLVPLMAGHAAAAPPAAWSYGRKTDSGLVLRIRDRFKLLLFDDLLSEAPSTVRAFEVGPDPTVERQIEMPQELEPYARLARDRLLEQLPGLRLHFSNQGEEPLTIVAESGAAVPEHIKVPDLPCDDCLEWQPPHSIRADVPAGEAFTVILGDVRDARLLLTLKRRDGSGQRLTVDLVDLEGPLSLAVDGGRWHISSGDPPPIGVGVWWNHAGLARSDDPSKDPEVRQSLRALGYVQ